MPNTIKWVEDIPQARIQRRSPAKRRPRFYSEMQELKKRPGAWANVINYKSRFTATNAATTFRNNGFEAAVRKSPGGWYKVYARYVELNK